MRKDNKAHSWAFEKIYEKITENPFLGEHGKTQWEEMQNKNETWGKFSAEKLGKVLYEMHLEIEELKKSCMLETKKTELNEQKSLD